MPGWLVSLITLFIQSFFGWMKQAGADEVREEIKESTDALKDKFSEIDARPSDSDSAIERMRARRPHPPIGRTS